MIPKPLSCLVAHGFDAGNHSIFGTQTYPDLPPCVGGGHHKFSFSNGTILCERCGYVKPSVVVLPPST